LPEHPSPDPISAPAWINWRNNLAFKEPKTQKRTLEHC
jgi:hypothetical protein